MNVVLFCHSLASDWNHGNAHFLRGVAAELVARGHSVVAYEPENGWSRTQLLRDHGEAALASFARRFPGLPCVTYDSTLDVDRVLAAADLVLVHEWNDPWLVAAVGAHRSGCGRCRVLFHDTHHRAVTQAEAMAACDLRHYDGVLAFGRRLRDLYAARGWGRRAFTWHEAADVRVFHPRPEVPRTHDLVFIGNWGDEERTAELEEYLLGPVRALRLTAHVHGVRYPEEARVALAEAGIAYRGWIPNHRVPEVFAAHRLTVHVPRRPYVSALPGIPTIRPFEAMACGIPLVCAPWDDVEGLFTPGLDHLVARDGSEMGRHLQALLREPAHAAALAAHGLATVRRRHTCAHRVDDLLEIHDTLRREPRTERTALA
jgi:spore maturation protein CgeB